LIEANHLYTILSDYLIPYHCRPCGRLWKNDELKDIHVFRRRKKVWAC